MTKEFVPYELAVKLKQLGFDELCFGIWKDVKLISVGGHWGADITHSMFGFEGDRFAHDECRAPTYSQAFKWFDDSTEYSGFIVPSPKVGLFTWWIQNYTEPQLSIESEESYSTREEAELACLDKLIETVELKDQEQ